MFHVAARSLAAQALSIFGDHSDVMAARSTGFGMLASNSVQEVMDMALIAQAATLESRVPFLHFFDGFRTSHEVAKVEQLTADDMRAMIDDELVRGAPEARALAGQAGASRHGAEPGCLLPGARSGRIRYYIAAPTIVQNAMDKFAQAGRPAVPPVRLRGRAGRGARDRHDGLGRGSGARKRWKRWWRPGEKVGLLKVRLYRPFAIEAFVAALPATVKSIAVLDRTKEPGAAGEPLYCDVITALVEIGRQMQEGDRRAVRTVVEGIHAGDGEGRVRRAGEEVAEEPLHGRHQRRRHAHQPGLRSRVLDRRRRERCGRCSTGWARTARSGANKNSIKIIGEETDNYAQGYFVYDSKKSGAITISHLRFGPKPIRSSYLITKANFVACHQFSFLERIDMLKAAEPGATFLLNSPFGPDEVWDHLPRAVQQQIIDKKLKFYVIDGYEVAKETGMGGRINTIMQTCFFAISGVLPREEAIEAIKHAIKKTYGKRGESVVQKNFAAVDAALDHLYEVKVPATVDGAVRHASGGSGRGARVRAEGDWRRSSPAKATTCR